MRASSPLQTALLLFLALAACASLYLIIDSFDMVRMSQERLTKSIEDQTRALNRVEQALSRLQSAGTVSAGGAGTPPQDAPPPFLNSDLADPDAETGGRRRTSISGFSGNLNNIINNEGSVGSFWDLCNDTLGGRNAADPKRLEPQLAERWETSPDGRVITVHLRPGVYWHDFTDPITGREWRRVPVTAQDFAFYLETIRNPELPCDPFRSYYTDLDRIEAVDDLTLRFVWKETYFLTLEMSLGMMPLPRHLYRPDPVSDAEFAEDLLKNKAERNQMIVGCGAYILQEYKAGDRILFRRNPDYYGPPPPLERLEIRQINDPEKQLIELKNRRIDSLGLTSVQWREQTKSPEFLTVCDDVDRGLELTAAHDGRKKEAAVAGQPFGTHTWEKYLYRSFSYNFIAWNLRKPLFADRKVRLALTHCVDRPRIIREVFLDLGLPVSGPFVPQSLYYDKSIAPWPFDLDRARALLAEAGWKDSDGDGFLDRDLDGDGTPERFTFTFLSIANHPYQPKWGPIVQDDMRKAGIEMKIKTVEWAVYTKNLESFAFDACSFYWGGGIESDPYQLWHSSQADKAGGSNVCGLRNAEADRLIETGRREIDQEKRIEIFKAFHRLIHEEQPYTFIYNPYAKAAVDKRFQRLIVYPQGMVNSQQWIPKRLQRE